MKTHLIIALALLSAATTAFAQSRDTELKVERRTLDRQDKISKPRQNAEELTRGLHITVKNTSFSPTAEGEVEWSILVARPGALKALFSSGTEKLPPLKAGEVATFDVGSIAVQEIKGNRQDMEYQVIVRRAGAEVAKHESTPTFAQQAESARGGQKQAKKAKKNK